jgi:hypothetical protein
MIKMEPAPNREAFYSRERSTFGELTSWFIQLKKMSEDNNKRTHTESNDTTTNSSNKRRYVVVKKSDK